MEIIEDISEVLLNNSSCIAIFTDGRKFSNVNGNRSTCCWAVNPHKDIKKILLYLRDTNSNESGGDIYLGDYISSVKEGKRCKLHFKNLVKVAITNNNWSKFAKTGSNPVKYIN